MRLRNIAVLCLSAAIGLGSGAAYAQGIVTGAVSGTIQDPTGAVIPGATIVATDVATGVITKAVANGSGDFTLTSLPVGTYKLVITAPGFSQINLDNVVVSTGQTNGLGVEKLNTGSAVETIQVSSGESLLETAQSQVSRVFDSEMIENLPLGGGLDQIALLTPGVAATHGANFSNTNGVGLSSNGQRGRSNNFEIDGQANNDNSVAGSQVFFQNQDAIAEIQVITNNFSAAYGRNMGSVVNYITKSGTNSIHGSGFEYYTGSWLSALTQGQKGPQFGFCQPGASIGTNGCTTIPHIPRFTDNTYGGTLGFPILKDKLFGFGSTQWSRDINGSTTYTSTTYFPTKAGLAALQAAFPNSAGVSEEVNYGPFAVAQGNPYSFTAVTPTASFPEKDVPICAQTLANSGAACPAGSPIIPFQLIGRVLAPHYYDQEHLGRLDYQLTPKDRFFLRYLYQNEPSIPSGGTFTSGAFYNVSDIAHSVGADYTHTFGPRWVNQVRYSFQQTTLSFDGGGFPSCTIKNLASCPSSVSIGTTAYTTAGGTAGSLASLGLGLATNIPQGRIVKVSQAQDNATWNLGRHSITFGGEFDYQNSPNVFLPYISGAFTFPNFNDLVGGYSSAVTLATGASPNIHFTEPDAAAYFQDDWKATPAITLNLGLRYEFFGQTLNLLHTTTVAAQSSATPQWDTSLPLSLTTFPFIPTFKKGFEPRIGFAYNPESMKKLVVRGGFAINFDPAYYNIALNSYSAAPIVNQSTFTGCNGTTVTCLPMGGFTGTAVHALDDKFNPSGGSPGQKTQTKVTPNFHNPYAESYTLGIQYEVTKAATLEIRYAGNHTIGNFQSFNGNPQVGPTSTTATFNGVVTPGVATFSGALVPAMSTYFPAVAGSYCTASALTKYGSSADLGKEYCGQTIIRTRSNTAFSNYNSLQTSLQTRNLYGFTGSANWTWGRQIDNSSEVFSSTTGNTNAFAQNPYNINTAERSIGATDYKNVTSVGLTYNMPFFKNGNKLLAKTVGGLRLNTIYTFNSGQPFTPSQNYYSVLGNSYSPAIGTNYSAVQKGNAEFSTCDYTFYLAGLPSYDTCRPFLGNPNAPKNTVAVNLGGGNYVDANGNAVQRSAVRYVVNNVNEELAQGTPFGNVQRNTAFGDSYNNVNFGAFKDFHVTERINLQMQMTLFNALNRGFYGTPGVLIDNAPVSQGASFNSFIASGGTSNGPSEGSATGSRNIQLGAKVLF